MQCLRRLSRGNPLNPAGAASRLTRIRWKSSRPRIQVVSQSPRSQRPVDQEHQWSFLSQPHSPKNTSDQDTTAWPTEETTPTPRRDRKSIRNAIEYTLVEKRLLEYVRRTEDYINQSRSPEDQVRVYFVGGWVRDKLLGKVPPDADVALHNISPAEFAQCMIDLNGFNSRSLRLTPTRQGQQVRRAPVEVTVGAFQFAYDKGDGTSLDVAGILFFSMGFKMEFTRMRKLEIIQGDTAEGTTKEDAMSRELSINAIFMRTKNLALLDPSGMGLEDLRRRVLRTPKTPKITLMEDPIRVLRIMRIASRLQPDGFTIDKDTYNALTDHDIRLALTTRFTPERIIRELSILLKPRNNPAHSLRLIHETKYYRDLFSPPRPSNQSTTYIPPTISANNSDYVTTSWFFARLVQEWDLWVPFEEALLDLPETNKKAADRNVARGLSILRENVQAFGYAMTSVMAWRRHPRQPFAEDSARTFAGMIVSTLQSVQKSWGLIDGMFDEDEKTVMAVERVLGVDCASDGMEFKEMYGEFWAAHVLCGAMFAWSDMARGRIEEKELEALWNESRGQWEKIALAVDRVRWDSWSEPSTRVSAELAS